MVRRFPPISFANPAATIARTLSDTFAGIAPSSAPMFIAMQLVGAAIAFALIRYLYPPTSPPTRSLPREPVGSYTMPDLDSLSIDQRYALKLAAATLHEEFGDFFSTETVERFLETSYDQFADRASSPTSCR